MRRFIFFLLSCLAVWSCNSSGNESLKYVPLENLKGEIKKLVTYSYDSDIQKNKIIAQYGAPIPNEIIYYNQYGSPEVSIKISLPDDDDPDICLVTVDSVKYDKRNSILARRGHVILTRSDDMTSFENPQLLLDSKNSYAVHTNVRVNVKDEKGKRIEQSITEGSVDIDKFYSLPEDMQNIILKSFFWLAPERFSDTTKLQSDTTTITYEYNEGRIVREIEEGKNQVSEIRRIYDGDKKTEEIRILNTDTTRTVFTYKNGKLSEERVGDAITRYDEQGREIARINGKELSIKTYRDTTEITTEHSERYSVSNYVTFKRFRKDGLVLFSAILSLDDRDMYVDDAVLLFEKYRDGVIDESALRDEMEAMVYKIDESNLNSIEKTIYDNYDSHGNPLTIVQSYTNMYNSYSFYSRNNYSKYFSTKKVLKTESRKITEREIEYYR